MTTAHFTTLKLHEKLLNGIIDAGFSHCMPVQEQTFVHTFKGRDVAVKSQTGTGKTAAFLVSIFQLLLHSKELSEKKVLIVAPTRELALQIESEAKLLGTHLDFKIGCLYGGVGYAKQKKLLARNVQIIIGTPGRLLDFHHQGILHFQDIGILVIDEADRMFDMGFLPDVRFMVKKMLPADQRLTMLFSATLDNRVRELAWEYMNNPVEIEIEADQVTVENITQELYHVGREEKMSLLLGILEQEQPGNALIFTNTKHEAVNVARRLSHNGFPCEFIMGDLPQSQRSKIIEGIKSGTVRYLVATDVAARGLHINDLELVVNYDLPLECENYVHRIGRTARAGKSGKAITLACDRYVLGLESVEQFINMKIPVTWATEDFFVKDESAGKSFSRQNNNGKRKRTDSGTRQRPGPREASSHKGSRGEKKARRKTAGEGPAETEKPRQKKKPPKKLPGKRRAQKPLTGKGRLDYYREKYGENFTPSDGGKAPDLPPVSPECPPQKTLFQRIRGLFTKSG